MAGGHESTIHTPFTHLTLRFLPLNTPYIYWSPPKTPFIIKDTYRPLALSHFTTRLGLLLKPSSFS